MPSLAFSLPPNCVCFPPAPSCISFIHPPLTFLSSFTHTLSIQTSSPFFFPPSLCWPLSCIQLTNLLLFLPRHSLNRHFCRYVGAPPPSGLDNEPKAASTSNAIIYTSDYSSGLICQCTSMQSQVGSPHDCFPSCVLSICMGSSPG